MKRQGDTDDQDEIVVKNQLGQKQNPQSAIPREPRKAEQKKSGQQM